MNIPGLGNAIKQGLALQRQKTETQNNQSEPKFPDSFSTSGTVDNRLQALQNTDNTDSPDTPESAYSGYDRSPLPTPTPTYDHSGYDRSPVSTPTYDHSGYDRPPLRTPTYDHSGYDRPPLPIPNPRQDVVDEAVGEIRGKLKDGFFDGVTPGEVRAITEILENLPVVETNAVVAELSDKDLNKWTDELYDGRTLGVFGSGHPSADQREDLYKNLARDLEPDQLNRFYQALGKEGRQAEFISVVGEHASDKDKADLVGILADKTTDNPVDRDSGVFSVSADYWDQDARFAGELIASIDDTDELESAVDSLNNEQLEAVLNAGIRHESFTATGVGAPTPPSHFFNTDGLTNILEAVGNSDNAELKARVFELGSRQIDEIRDTDSFFAPNPSAKDRAGEVSDALSGLLDTDTTGIITALETGEPLQSSEAGNGISSYMAELVRQDDTEQITTLIGRLKAGNDLDENPEEFLREFDVLPGSDDIRDFQNASNLGYLVGAAREGISAIESDRREQAELISTIFGVGLSLAGGRPGLSQLAKAGLVLARPLSKEIIEGISADLASGHISLGDALEALALPDGVNSSDVTGPFGDAIDQVVRN